MLWMVGSKTMLEIHFVTVIPNLQFKIGRFSFKIALIFPPLYIFGKETHFDITEKLGLKTSNIKTRIILHFLTRKFLVIEATV